MQDQEELMLKVIIGAAWADQDLAPQEITALQGWLERLQQHRNRQLLALLREPIPLQQTETWLLQYLQGATYEERLRLLGAIGNLIIADRRVTDSEHQLLDDYHALMAAIPPAPDPVLPENLRSFVQHIGKTIKKVLNR
ncbi:MAG: hypothetical protein Q6J68_07030 [Thermostichales cyanobacterium SZTDM-1c_bins_54]